jgi:23S rRNA G2069 N7-methylase RlmK/C1962 C5-methylase RlmI
LTHSRCNEESEDHLPRGDGVLEEFANTGGGGVGYAMRGAEELFVDKPAAHE